jgi:lipoprotein-releasing system permease protein
MAHINVMEKEPGYGIEDWRGMAARLRKLPHVTDVSPALYTPTLLTGGLQPKYVILKGIDVNAEVAVSEALRRLKSGSLDRLRDPAADPPGIVLGSGIVRESGMILNSRISAAFQGGELTPIGPRLLMKRFRVSGIFETGFFEIDEAWAYASLAQVQKALSLDDVVNQIELKLDNLDLAPEVAARVEKEVGPKYTTQTWMERNRNLMDALKMERRVTVITIGLIELVAALNILITLVMMVMEKYRDIAVLMSMGARRAQIRRIFMLQGVLIGAAGSAIGLTLGYGICYLADKYRWVPLSESVYSMSFVPFEPRPYDGIWIAAAAILVSFLATIYPARSATRITPAEVLRYE